MNKLSRSNSRTNASTRRLLFGLTALVIAFYCAQPFAPTRASNPTAGTLNPADPGGTSLQWDGTATGGSSANGEDPTTCIEGATCDSYTLTISGQPTDWAGKKIHVQISWLIPATDYDLYVHKDTVTGPIVKQSAGSAPSTSEQVDLDPSGPGGTGVFVVHVVYFTAVGDQYHGTATINTAPPPPPPPTPATGIGPRFQVFPAPNGLGGSAGEPSIGVNWQTGRVFLLAGFQVLRVTFNDCPSPALTTWEDKSPQSVTSLDPILFTDHMRAPGDMTPDRTFDSQLTGQDSHTQFTDNDGDTWLPSQGGGIPSGVDHQTIGAGPYHTAQTPPVHTYPNAVYYCSQELVTAFCARSDDGGATFGPGIPIYTSECGGIHGHAKVAPNGTVYVPNRDCGGLAGVARSQDNGVSWAVKTVPTSSTTGFLVDPSLGIGTNDVGKPNGQTVSTIYLGYQAGDGHAHIAASHDEGDTWANDQDAGAQGSLKNTTFPEVVAGDDNRVAYAFLGTTVAGNYTDPTGFPDSAPWHLYIATSYDGGGSYHLFDATPNDPVQRGTICNLGTTPCMDHDNAGFPDRNLLDFMDETIDAEGRVLVGYPDGCITQTCINNTPAQGAHPNDYAALGTIARQSGGRRLFAANDPVEPGVPAAPQVTAARDVNNVVHVMWTTPDDGGSPITGYKIYRGSPGSGEILLTTVPAGVNTYDDTTADPNVTYYYRVTAVNLIGEGLSCGLAYVVVPESPCRLPGRTVVVDSSDSGANTPPDPRVDIQAISIAEPFFGTGVNKLVFTMKLAPSTMPTAPPNTEWYIIWNRLHPDADFDRYYLLAKSDATGAPGAMTYEYGKFGVPLPIGGVPNPNANTPVKLGDADAGTYDPITGVLTFTLATDKAEMIQPGQSLVDVNGRTYLGRANEPGPKSQNNANDITGNGTYTLAGNATCTSPAVGGVIISEFRFRGPSQVPIPLNPNVGLPLDGSTDEFIELYNTTSSNVVVGANGWALATDGGGGTPQILVTVPNGTSIPAHGHYLLANSGGYSLGGYALPDQSYAGDIADDSGVALFSTAVLADLTQVNRLDAAGFTNANALFKEGAGLSSPGANSGEYSFVRNMALTGLPKDTGDNAADFSFVSTNAGQYGGAQSTLGAPGPENTTSPIQRNAQIKASAVDPQCTGTSSDPTSACARVRDSADTGPNKTFGTVSFRRRFTNKTGLPITRLRFRIVDTTTLGNRTTGQADLRALTSSDIVVTRMDGTTVPVKGTTVETPPAQGMGGGLNTSLVVTLGGGQLAPGAPVDVQLVVGVEAAGSFRFFINVEAVLGTPSSGLTKGAPGKLDVGPVTQAQPPKVAAPAQAPVVVRPWVQLPQPVAPEKSTTPKQKRKSTRRNQRKGTQQRR
jgi:hypothetical protein